MGAKLSGSSGKKYGIEQNADINVTPFVDVMLVLLIIFMVAAPLATQSLKIDLPPPNPNSHEIPKWPIVLVQVLNNGDVYVGVKDKAQVKTSVDALPGALNGVFSQAGVPTSEQRVTIRAEVHVPYGSFMGVMNSLENSGYSKIGLALEGA
jgi:biopolymer transport protein ExbD